MDDSPWYSSFDNCWQSFQVYVSITVVHDHIKKKKQLIGSLQTSTVEMERVLGRTEVTINTFKILFMSCSPFLSNGVKNIEFQTHPPPLCGFDLIDTEFDKIMFMVWGCALSCIGRVVVIWSGWLKHHGLSENLKKVYCLLTTKMTIAMMMMKSSWARIVMMMTMMMRST